MWSQSGQDGTRNSIKATKESYKWMRCRWVDGLVAGGGCWCGRGGRKLKITYIFTFQPNNVERQYSLRMNYYYYHHLHLLLLHPHSLTCTHVWPCLWGMDCGRSRWRSARQKKYYFAIIGQNLSRKINFPTGTALIPWAIDCAHQTAETAAGGGGWLAAWLSQETTYTVHWMCVVDVVRSYRKSLHFKTI